MAGLRAGFLILYLVGTYLLTRYLREHLPESDGTAFPIGGAPSRALLWIWVPTLWVFPGVLWLGHINLSPLVLLTLVFLLPLCCLYLFLLASAIFTAHGQSANGPSLLLTTLSVCFLTVFVVLVFVIRAEVSWAKFALFCVSSVAPTLASIWLLLTLAPSVAPLPEDVDRPLRTALALVLGYFSGTPKPVWVVEDGKVHTRVSGSAGRGIGPGIIVTEPENVVVLKAGAKVTRVVGPGSVLTEPGETPLRVVDLRAQTRSATVSAITRDGIEVRVPVSSTFRIQQGAQDTRLGAPWPWRTQRDVLQAVFAEEVDPSGLSPLDAHTAHPWEDLPIKLSAHRLEQAISFYSLDQLYGGITDARAARTPLDPQNELLKTHRLTEASLGLPRDRELGDPLCRKTVGEVVRRSVQQSLAPRGFEITGCEVGGPIEPVSQAITEQRVEAWKARFITLVMDWHASIERKRSGALDRIRRTANSDLIAGVIEETSERLRDVDAATKRGLVAYHVLDYLISMARVPEVRRMLPESALPTLEQLFHKVEAESSGGGDS